MQISSSLIILLFGKGESNYVHDIYSTKKCLELNTDFCDFLKNFFIVERMNLLKKTFGKLLLNLQLCESHHVQKPNPKGSKT
jgi:hypothetical protein